MEKFTMTDKIDLDKEVTPNPEDLEQVKGGTYVLKDVLISSVKKRES